MTACFATVLRNTHYAPGVYPPFPLDDWLDGSIWRIWHGEDFDIDRRLMRASLHRYARHRDLHVVTRYVESGCRLGIVFRAAGSRAELDDHGR